MADNERRKQLLLEEQALLLKKAQRPTGVLDVTEQVIGKGLDLAGQPLVPQAGIGRPIVEAGLRGAGALVPGGRAAAEPFLKDPATRTVMGLGAGLATQPALTLGAVGGGLLGETLAPPGRKKIGGLVGGLVGGGIGKGVAQIGKSISAKAAGGIVNSMIKPKAKAFQWGKNPGQEVAKQNITGNSLEQLGQNISNRIEGFYATVKGLVSKSKKPIDFQPALDPINTELALLRQNPATNKAAIAKIEGFLSDIIGIKRGVGGKFTAKRPLTKMSAQDALNMKQGVGNIARWSGTDTPPRFEGLVHKVYHIMRTQMEKSIPDIKAPNNSIANLIGAQKAIPSAIAAAEKVPLGGLASLKTAIAGGLGTAATGFTPAGAVGGIAIQKALQAPATGTRIAGALSKLGKLRGLTGAVR